MRSFLPLLPLALLLAACDKSAPPPSATMSPSSAEPAPELHPTSFAPKASSSSPAPPPSPADAHCGTSPSDWCPSPPGDPCGEHKNVKDCRADKKCKGMPYKGESLVACKDDGSGFATNCPTVGCISR